MPQPGLSLAIVARERATGELVPFLCCGPHLAVIRPVNAPHFADKLHYSRSIGTGFADSMDLNDGQCGWGLGTRIDWAVQILKSSNVRYRRTI